MAMLKPDRLNISTSFGWSPMVAISSVGTSRCAREIFHHGALVRVLVGDVEIIGLRPARRRALAECRLGVGFAALHLVEIVADADDLGDLLKLLANVRHDLRLEFDRPGFARDMRRVGLGDQPVIAAVDPGVETVRADELDRLGARHRPAPSSAPGS